MEEQVVQRTSALKEAKDDLEMIAYIASHDLKTPLRSISHISNWIEEDINSGSYDELSDYSSLLRTRVARIETLLDSLIEYTNLNSINTITTGLDTKALVLSILHREQEENQFKYAITGDFPVMDTVPKLLEKVFRNLIRNGITYNKKAEKELKIHARKLPSGLMEFSVKDNGNGIEKRYENKIFELFQTLERKDERESSGVGLPIVKKIVNSHGGTIRFESEVGVGTTFYFTWKII